MALDYGWGKFNNGDFKLAFENSQLSVKFENNITILPGHTIIGFSFGEMAFKFVIINTRFKIQADAELAIAKFVALQTTGAPFKVEWQIATGGAAGDFFAMDGTTRSMLMLCDGITNFTKSGGGNQTKYHIPRIVFKEASK